MNKNNFLVVAYDTNDIHAKQNRGGDNTVFDFANFDKHLPVYNDFVVASRTKGWVTNALRVNNRLRPQQ